MENKTTILITLLVTFLCIASFSSVASAQVQTYYVLGDEANSLLNAYENTSYGSTGGWVNGTVSIVAWKPVNVTIDKDEIGGYNGVDDFKVLSMGEIWTLDTSDLGGDYIRANGSISVVRTAWWFDASPNDLPGKFVAGTWELYPTGAWGTNYVVPIATVNTELIVQAKEDNTDVTVGAGPAVTLNRGEDKHFADVPVKTKITATKPIQAGILTNKGLGGGYGWDTRFFTLTPRSLLGNDYYIPVPSFAQNYTSDEGMQHPDPVVKTNLTIYAFNASTGIWIETAGGTLGPITLGADGTYEYQMPVISGGYINEGDLWLNGSFAAHVYANDTIWVLGSADDTDDDYDWGFQSLNASLLMDYYYIPWSPANPAYVTPVADATFYVDLDADGTEEYSFTLDRLNMSTIYPNSTKYKVAPLNLTGAEIWTDGVPFAIQWGQDNNEDTPGERAVNTSADNDFGYTVLPLQKLPTLVPDIGIVKFVDGVKSKMVVHNQTVTFTLNVTNTGNVTLREIVVNDTLPAKLTFVNSAIPVQDSATLNADRTTTIIWQTNLTAELGPGNYTLITFNATIDPDAEIGVTHTNKVTVNATSDYGDAGPKNDSASVYLEGKVPDIGIVKFVDGVKSKMVVHNQTVTFTLNVTNTGNVTLREIVVNDTLPAKLTFVNSAIPVQDSATLNADRTTTIIWQTNLTAGLEPGNYTLITFNATIDPDAEIDVTHTNKVTVNATSDYGDAGPKSDSASVYLERSHKVPVLTPFGIAALIGLLSLVAVLSMSKGVRKKRV